MDEINRVLIIIYDSFKNVLVVQRNKEKYNVKSTCSLIGKDLKGKEAPEKSIAKAVDSDLGCIIFNLEFFGQYACDEDKSEKLLVYTGIIRERINLHKKLYKAEWISEEKLEGHNFSVMEKEILMDYFKDKNK